MKRTHISIIFCIALFTGLASCSQDELSLKNNSQELGTSEITIRPVILNGPASRLDNPTDTVDNGYDARNRFIYAKKGDPDSGDKLVMTNICRTENPISTFTYYNKHFTCGESGAWLSKENVKLYWTDSKEHTFIGYSVPKLATGTFKFAPKEGQENGKDGLLVPFYAELAKDQTSAAKLKEVDLLLTDTTTLCAELLTDNVAATLHMHHALAKVKIILNIKGFAFDKNAEKDIETRVSDIKLTKQPLNYVWNQKGVTVNATNDAKTDSISAWNINEEGEGTENDKKFTAYALLVPGTRSFDICMTVTYSDVENPNPDGTYPKKRSIYKAEFKDVTLTSGKRTTLNVTLVHSNESMIIKATYSDWEEVDLDDRSDLQKESIFLQSLENSYISSIKLATDVVDKDKADWLYIKDGTTIEDRYGNNGTSDNPYLIKTAREMLAFRKEVENGRKFEGQWVKLYTDIYLQKDNASEDLIWPGIGDDTHEFAGTFEGNSANILSLVGNPLFNTLAEGAKVQHLTVQTYDARKATNKSSYATNGAILCGTNNGTIMGCATYGTVSSEDNAGGIAIINNGKILASYHQGNVSAKNAAGGLVYQNKSFIKACYQANGNISGNTKAGLVASNEGGTITYCFYDNFCAPGIVAVVGETSESDTTFKGYSMNDMNKANFKEKLNADIEMEGVDVTYIQNPGDYPTLKW